MHEVDPVVALYVPTSQLVQGVEPEVEKVPTVHAVQFVAACPVAHELQKLAPADEYVLRAHAVHTVEPEVE